MFSPLNTIEDASDQDQGLVWVSGVSWKVKHGAVGAKQTALCNFGDAGGGSEGPDAEAEGRWAGIR